MRENYADARVLIPGGTGFIGRQLASRLTELGADVVTLGRSSPTAGLPNTSRHIQVDISDASALTKLVAKCEFDYVFNLAGDINHTPLEKHGRTIIDVHFKGLVNLISTVTKPALTGFVQVGSSDEYGKGISPQKEAQREGPSSPYSVAKTAGTHLVQSLARTSDFPGVVVRLFLTYGPGQNLKRFLPQVIMGCLEGRAFPVSEGKQIRDFCFVSDAVEGMLLAAIAPTAKGEVLNIASGQPTAIRNVIEKVQEIVGNGNPQFGEIVYRPGENMSLYADTTLATQLLGWSASTTLDDGLIKTIEHYKRLLN